MVVETTPLQYDMFTGKCVDTRTAKQRQADKTRHDWKQLEMFHQRDLAQFGVSANPVMDVSPGRLVLIREDPRTDEEKEADLRRAAEARTKKMFDFEPEQAKHTETPPTTPQPVENTPVVAPAVEEQPENPKLTAYLAVIQAMYERAVTTWIAEEYRNRLLSQLPLAVLDAVSAGLQSSEIVAAVHVGQSIAVPDVPPLIKSDNTPAATQKIAVIETGNHPSPMYPIHGYREHARKQTIRLRTRQPNIKQVA